NVNDTLYRVKGVGQVAVYGAGDYAMRIWVKPDLLAKLGITVPDISAAVQQQSTVNPAGKVGAEPAPKGQQLTYTVRAQGRLDTTLPVTEGIREIVKTLLAAIVLVILVVFLFLQSWRATLIPMIAVPVSLVGTFAVFPLLGFSINTLSLFGLILAVGLVVDDA